CLVFFFFFFQAEDGIRDRNVTGVKTCALPISPRRPTRCSRDEAARSCDRLRRSRAPPLRARAPRRTSRWLPSFSSLGGRVPRAQIGRASCRESVEVGGGGGGVERREGVVGCVR